MLDVVDDAGHRLAGHAGTTPAPPEVVHRPSRTGTGFEQFVASAARVFVPLAVECEDTVAFRGDVRAHVLDDLVLAEIAASPLRVERHPDLPTASDTDYVKLHLQLTGSSILVQDGRETVLLPGDMAITATERSYSIAYHSDFRALVLMLPMHRVAVPAAALEQVTAVRMDATAVGAGAVGDVLRRFHGDVGNLPLDLAQRMIVPIGELVSVMLAAAAARVMPPRDRHEDLLAAVRSYIDEHLADPRLTPTRVAEAQFVSLRHLHLVFRGTGSSVATWIRERRLARCRQDLLDPMQTATAIHVIAARWGLVNAAHFSRLYREHYGERARDTRARVRTARGVAS